MAHVASTTVTFKPSMLTSSMTPNDGGGLSGPPMVACSFLCARWWVFLAASTMPCSLGGILCSSSLPHLWEHAELLQQTHLVQIRPVLHQLTASHTENVCLCPRDLLAGGRHPHHFPLVRPTRSQAGHHGLPLGCHLLRRPLQVGAGTGIEDEEVFEALGTTHGGGTARPGEAMVSRD